MTKEKEFNLSLKVEELEIRMAKLERQIRDWIEYYKNHLVTEHQK